MFMMFPIFQGACQKTRKGKSKSLAMGSRSRFPHNSLCSSSRANRAFADASLVKWLKRNQEEKEKSLMSMKSSKSGIGGSIGKSAIGISSAGTIQGSRIPGSHLVELSSIGISSGRPLPRISEKSKSSRKKAGAEKHGTNTNSGQKSQLSLNSNSRKILSSRTLSNNNSLNGFSSRTLRSGLKTAATPKKTPAPKRWPKIPSLRSSVWKSSLSHWGSNSRSLISRSWKPINSKSKSIGSRTISSKSKPISSNFGSQNLRQSGGVVMDSPYSGPISSAFEYPTSLIGCGNGIVDPQQGLPQFQNIFQNTYAREQQTCARGEQTYARDQQTYPRQNAATGNPEQQSGVRNNRTGERVLEQQDRERPGQQTLERPNRYTNSNSRPKRLKRTKSKW
jgi:hypothetical protein